MTDETKDDDMTLQEREEWLKSRGVQIETPEDRKITTSRQSVVEQLMGNMSCSDSVEHEATIQFVLIPHDSTKPLQTLHLPSSFTQSSPGNALPEYVKPYFADSKSIDSSLLNEQATKHFAGGDLKGLTDTNISAASMNAVAAQGSVETFPLVHPADTNGFVGVYVYLDEVGLLKKLPHNTRASKIAETCGFYPAPSFYGDIFIGRVQTKPAMKNVDFIAGADTDRGAAWMQRAVPENLAWQQEMNQVAGKTGQTQPEKIGTEGNAAMEETFQWTQDDDELEITVPNLSSPLDKNAIKVVFMPKSIKVKYAGADKLAVSLYGGVDVDGCTWTIEGGSNLVITCEKAKSGEMWPRIHNK